MDQQPMDQQPMDQQPMDQQPMDHQRSKIAHLYRRAGFGATPGELDAAVARGYEGTVEHLLDRAGPDTGGDGAAAPLFNYQQPATLPADPMARRALEQQLHQAAAKDGSALVNWWLDRMIGTSTPLREKMTLVWHGHFATGLTKVRRASLMYSQNQIFRTQGRGNFETLAQAVAKDPAMLLWLDSNTNKKGHPNENFARELMELFTLGIGQYSEADVKEGARCFTGWTYDSRSDGFRYQARQHDDGVKTFLGTTGNLGGEDVIHLVAHQPASFRWIVSRVWSHLAYPVAPDDPVVSDLLQGYSQDLDITRLLRAIFLHPAFTGPVARRGLVKQPIEWVVGIMRVLHLSRATLSRPDAALAAKQGRREANPLAAVLKALGQTPFEPPSVGGWPQNTYWLTTATALARLNFAALVASVADTSAIEALPAGQRVNALADQLSVDGWGSTTAAALGHVATDPRALLALGLNAPEYVLN